MIRKGSVRHRRATNSIRRIKNPTCLIPISMKHLIALDGTIEFYGRRMPAALDPFTRKGVIHIIENHGWYKEWHIERL